MITQSRVKELFDYDALSGSLIWSKAKKPNQIEAGTVAGTPLGTKGYIRITVDGKSYLCHRLIYLYHHGYLPENEVDHTDQDPTNNRIENLREVSKSCNLRNSKVSARNTSGIKGVSWHKRIGKWLVRITNGEEIYLGYFDDFTEAVAHRLAAEQALDWSSCNRKTSANIYIDNYTHGLS